MQFYDDSSALTYPEQGEVASYHLFKFAISNHEVTLELLDRKNHSPRGCGYGDN